MAVFHPDHDELHGFTVCITTSDGGATIGRWMEEESGRIRLVDAAAHLPDGEGSRDEFIKQAALWGVQPSAPQTFVSRELVEDVRKLGELATELRGW